MGLANERCENRAYGSTSKLTRSILSLPATRPETSWILNLKPQTCINICRFSGKCCQTRSFPRCTTCYVTSYALESMRKGVALFKQTGYTDKRAPPISAQEVYQNFMRNSLSGMHSIHAGCLKGACAVYNLGKHYVMPSLWKHTLALSTHNCGIRKRELGADSSTKGIWTLCGCLCKCRLGSWPRKRHTAAASKGCCPGPYVTVAPDSNKRLQLWLRAAHLMHQADTAATCHMGRTTLCPHQSIASKWWTKSESPSGHTLNRPLRKKDTNAWPSSWNGVQCVIGRAGRHMNLGLPVEHQPLLHTPCPKQAHPQAASQQDTPTMHRQGHKSTHPKHTSTLRHGQREPEQTEPEHRDPLSEGAESDATCCKQRVQAVQKGWRLMHRLADLTLWSSYCPLDMPPWDARQHGGCRSIGMGLGQTYQVQLSAKLADSHTADRQWVNKTTPYGQSKCLQGSCIINVHQQPVVHPIPLSSPYPPAPRCGTRMQADLHAHQLLHPQGTCLCTNISLSCSACHFAFDTGHVCSASYMSGQCPSGSSTNLMHAAGTMPDPSAEQPPP